MNGVPIITGFYKMRSVSFAWMMLSLYGLPVMLCCGVAFLMAIGAAIFIDLKWSILALMIILIIVPGILAYFYIFHAFKPLNLINVIDHRVSFNEDNIIVEVIQRHGDEEVDSTPLTYLKTIPYTSIENLRVGIDSVTILTQDRSQGFLWVPSDVFPSPDEMTAAFSKISSALAFRKV